jgi:N-carbamoyl-L-amino-acid hydrolase
MLADVRDIDLARRDAVLANLRARAHAIAAARRVEIEIEVLNADAPAEASPIAVDALRAAAANQSSAYQMMVSRAYHDSLFMAQISPFGMLFIPCRAGVSHRPDEFASSEDIACGVRVLAEALASLAA